MQPAQTGRLLRLTAFAVQLSHCLGRVYKVGALVLNIWQSCMHSNFIWLVMSWRTRSPVRPFYRACPQGCQAPASSRSLINVRQAFHLPANPPAGNFVAATAMNLSGSRWRPRRPCWWLPGTAEQWQTQRTLSACWTALANPSTQGVCTACSVHKVFDRETEAYSCGLWSSTRNSTPKQYVCCADHPMALWPC